MKTPLRCPLIIVSAPSGAGKSSFCRRAVSDFPLLMEAVSFTTRSPRSGESEGDPYHFVDKKKFFELRDNDFFVEWAEVYGNFYGTPRDEVKRAGEEGKVLITDVDLKGAESFKKLFPDALTIFILPPSIDELRLRLEKRDKGKTSNLDMRLEAAKREMAMAPQFDHQIVNADFEVSYTQFKKIIEDLLKAR